MRLAHIEQAVAEVQTLCKSEAVVAIQRGLVLRRSG